MVSSAKGTPVNNRRFVQRLFKNYVTRISQILRWLAKFQVACTLIFSVNPKGVIYFTE